MKSSSLFRPYIMMILCVALSAVSNPGCGGSGTRGVNAACGDITSPLSCGDDCAVDPCGTGTYCLDDECAADCVEGDGRCGSHEKCSATGQCIPEVIDLCNEPNPPAGCDDECSVDEDCGATATYCHIDHCVADCAPGDDSTCAAGEFCSGRGRCEPDNSCADVTVHPTRTISNVWFLIDRSASMKNSFGGTSRWNAARNAVLQVVDNFGSAARFGFTTYSAEEEDRECPVTATADETVGMKLNNFDAIETLYSDMSPQHGTPTGESLEETIKYLESNPAEGGEDDPTVIILATDGEPDLCSNGSTTNTARKRVVDATKWAYDSSYTDNGDYDPPNFTRSHSYKLFVLSVADDVGEDHLQEVANAGVHQTSGNAQYWTGDDPDGLEDAFIDVVGQQISCDVALNGTITPGSDVCDGVVHLGSTQLECETDFTLLNSTTLRIIGDACNEFKMSGATLTARFPCDVIVPE